MLELQIAVCILCGINLIGLFVVLIKIGKKVDLTNDFKEMGNSISLKMVNEQGSLKEHMAKEIGSNNEKMLNLYNNFSSELVNKINKEEAELKEHIAKQIGDNNTKMSEMYNKFAKDLNDSLSKSIKELNEKVETKLSDGFKQTNETFQGILERISKIDEAQKKIEQLSTNIISLQDILADKKSRGCFGEIQLHNILASVFGDKNDKVYKLQHKIAEGAQPDAILYTPEPLGMVCIDSKFPLENYQRMMDKTISETERKLYEKEFKKDVRAHIDTIASKYIIKDVTSDQAIMFLPAEAIFAEINAYHPDIVTHAQSKRVWLTSPTTLMATLTTIEVVLRNIERDKHTKEIQIELGKLSEEFSRYRTRWDNLSKSIVKVNKEIEEINTTTKKITNKFNAINKVELTLEEEIQMIEE